MAETPYGPYSGGGRRAGGRRTAAGRSWERSFRCPATARRPREAPMARYADFIRLHEEISAGEPPRSRRLWWAGSALALLAGLVTFAGVLAFRGPFGVRVPIFAGPAATAEGAAFGYALCVLAGTLQATALLQVLVAVAARPVRAFAWIGGFAVTLLTLFPFAVPGTLGAALVTAAFDLVLGAGVVTLLSAVAASSLPPRPVRP